MSESVCLFVSLSLSLFCCRGCLLRLDCCACLMHDLFRSHRLHHSIFQIVWCRRRSRQVREIVQQTIAHVFLVLAVLPRRVFLPPFCQVRVVLFQFFFSQLVVYDDSFRVRLIRFGDVDDVLRGVDGFEDVVWALDVSARGWVFSGHRVAQTFLTTPLLLLFPIIR